MAVKPNPDINLGARRVHQKFHRKILRMIKDEGKLWEPFTLNHLLKFSKEMAKRDKLGGPGRK